MKKLHYLLSFLVFFCFSLVKIQILTSNSKNNKKITALFVFTWKIDISQLSIYCGRENCIVNRGVIVFNVGNRSTSCISSSL